MMLNQTSAQALATFVTRVRPDWDHPGVMAAIHKASTLGTATQVARALINLAENPDLRTPAILHTPGSHWRTSETSTPELRGSHDVKCPEHPTNVHPCPQCAAKRCLPDPVEHGDYLEAKKALAGARPVAATTKAPQLTDAENAAIARAKLDKETNR
jgi:hypothetical protein